jgi:hypothetical protein
VNKEKWPFSCPSCRGLHCGGSIDSSPSKLDDRKKL